MRGETPSIGANGVDDLRLWTSEPSERAGTGHAHLHRVEHSEATGRDACRLDGLTPVPVDPPILCRGTKFGHHSPHCILRLRKWDRVLE
jgi:hypothetical protein